MNNKLNSVANNEALQVFNSKPDIYKCPLCKSNSWNIFSKNTYTTNDSLIFGYTPYLYGDYTHKIKNTDEFNPKIFVMASCKNCGFIANFDMEIIKRKFKELSLQGNENE